MRGKLKVILTGGAGFIGSHIVDKLMERGEEVLVIDDLSSGDSRNLPTGVEFYNLNIADRKITNIVTKFSADAIIHCAAQASVLNSMKDPVFDAEVNILHGLKIFNSAIQSGIKSYIYLNTGGALYGEPEYLPCDEEHPIAPISPYGLSKWTLETYINLLAPKSVDFTSLRLANVYGPRQDPNGEAGVVAIFIQKMLNQEDVTIFGDGEQTRDFVYVQDVAESVTSVLDKRVRGYINIGSGLGISVNDIFHKLSAETGYRKKPIYTPDRPGDVRHIYLNVSKAKSDLDWIARTSIGEGVKLTINALRKG